MPVTVVNEEWQMLGQRHLEERASDTVSDRELGIAVVLLFVILAVSALVVPAFG